MVLPARLFQHMWRLAFWCCDVCRSLDVIAGIALGGPLMRPVCMMAVALRVPLALAHCLAARSLVVAAAVSRQCLSSSMGVLVFRRLGHGSFALLRTHTILKCAGPAGAAYCIGGVCVVISWLPAFAEDYVLETPVRTYPGTRREVLAKLPRRGP